MTRSLTQATVVAAVMVMALAGCGKGSKKNIKIEGVEGPRVNFVDGKFTMAVTLKGLQIDYGARVPIPHMPNSYLEIGPDFQSNGYLINTGIDPDDLKKIAGDGVNLLDPTALPGGRPLPGIAEGFLPGMAVEVPKIRHMVFYAGQALFGVFVPVKLPWKDYMGTFRFYDGMGDAIGNISIVGQDSQGQNSGFLLLVHLRGKVNTLMASR